MSKSSQTCSLRTALAGDGEILTASCKGVCEGRDVFACCVLCACAKVDCGQSQAVGLLFSRFWWEEERPWERGCLFPSDPSRERTSKTSANHFSQLAASLLSARFFLHFANISRQRKRQEKKGTVRSLRRRKQKNVVESLTKIIRINFI